MQRTVRCGAALLAQFKLLQKYKSLSNFRAFSPTSNFGDVIEVVAVGLTGKEKKNKAFVPLVSYYGTGRNAK